MTAASIKALKELKSCENTLKLVILWNGEISQSEYQEIFRKIRQLIEMIEHDPRLGWKGFELKQKIRETCRVFLEVERELYGEIWLDDQKTEFLRGPPNFYPSS